MKVNLNLIPEFKKAEIRKHRQFMLALNWQIQLFGILLVFVAMLAGLNYTLDVIAESVEMSENKDLKEIKKVDSVLQEVNSRLAEIDKIYSGHIYWSVFFKKLNGAAMESIEIRSISTKNFTSFISGVAGHRDDLIKFKQNLEQESCFENVNLPLSNLVSKDDVSFQIDVSVKKDCIINVGNLEKI